MMSAELDLRGKECDEFLTSIYRVLIKMNVGESIKVIADKDRLLCLHMLLKSSKYLYNANFVEDHVEINIKRIRA